jgi:ferredoxin
MGFQYLRDVVTLELDRGKCTLCGMCTNVCVHGVLAVDDNGIHILDRDACMECGACAMNCPAEAVTVRAGPFFGTGSGNSRQRAGGSRQQVVN